MGIPEPEQDTAVVYDVMRETANRLVAQLANQSEKRGGPTAHAEVLKLIRDVRKRAAKVPTRDYEEIVAATAAFRGSLRRAPRGVHVKI